MALPLNRLANSLDPQIFSIEVQPPKTSILDRLKDWLGFGSDKRLEFLFNGQEISVAARENAPTFIGSRQWVEVRFQAENCQSKTLYLNINSVSNKTGLTIEQIRSRTLGNILNESAFIPVQDIDKAKGYIRDNEKSLQESLSSARANNQSYIVMRKEQTGLRYNLEYHGVNEVYLRYQPDIANGISKSASKMVDLFNDILVVKLKLVTSQNAISKEQKRQAQASANEYKKARKNDLQAEYQTQIVSIEDAEKEAYLGKGLPCVQQNLKFVVYTKEHRVDGVVVAKVQKAAIYTLQQRGSIKNFQNRSSADKEQAAISMIRNVAALHRAGVCHNDIKGANFVWNKLNGKVETKLIDLGLSTNLESSHNYRKGAQQYLPPEILVNNGEDSFEDSSMENKTKKEISKLNIAKDGYSLGLAILRNVYGICPSWINHNNEVDYENCERKMSYESICFLFETPRISIPDSMREIILGLMNPNPHPKSRISPEQAESFLDSYQSVSLITT